MPTYTANVINKAVQNGTLIVEIEYTHGEHSFRDKLISRSGQATDWIAREVERRLADLEGLDVLQAAVQVGTVAPEIKPPSVEPTAAAIYAAELRKFEGWLNAFRQGVTTPDRPAFVSLKQWLTDHWDDSYIELYLR